jgi:hypothetical protein
MKFRPSCTATDDRSQSINRERESQLGQRRRTLRRRVLTPIAAQMLLDGYAFDHAYSHTHRDVCEQYQDQRFPWPAAYVHPAFVQGTGRALWSMNGTGQACATACAGKFADARTAQIALNYRPDNQIEGVLSAYKIWRRVANEFAGHAAERRPA